MKIEKLVFGGALVLAAQATPALAEVVEGAAEAAEGNVIVVTAQKREEGLLEVPISISVVSGDSIVAKGAAQLTDFAGYIPGLQVDSAGSPGQATISLRGIGPLGPSATVATYLDEAPVGSSSVYARSAAFNLELLPYDVAQIEVLKGPQGTLYGASAIGGLLKYVTVKPSLDSFEGKAAAEVFGINGAGDVGYAVQAFTNVPLAEDRAGLTLSYARRETPGYIDNAQTGARDQNDVMQQGARAALRFDATERLSILLSGIWQEIKSDNNALVAQDVVTQERIGNGRSFNNYVDEPFSRSFYWGAATVELDLDFATLSSTSTYSEMTNRQRNDATRIFGELFPIFGAPEPGISVFDITLDLEKFTQEVRLSSPSDERFEWLLGAFYTHEDSANWQNVSAQTFAGDPIVGLDPLAIAGLPSTYREYAAFGNATYKFTDKFDISGGLRWARNEQKFLQITEGSIVPTENQGGQSAEEVVTFSVGPRWRPNDDIMTYFRVATGYRPGGPNVFLPGLERMVKSDTLTNYEFGVKAQLFDRMVTVDAAMFRMDWSDIQLTVTTDGVSGGANAGRARSQGIEGSVLIQPAPGLSIALNGAYIDAKLTEDTPPSVGGKKGDRLPRIPDFSGSASIDYGFAVGEAADAAIGLGVRYVGERVSGAESGPQVAYADPYTAVDLNASITFAERFTVRGYARNLLDSDGALSRDLGFSALGLPIAYIVAPVQPRTVGVAFEVAF